MILYHASTMYQLLYCITHKLAVHAGEDCRLLLVELIVPPQQRDDFLARLRAQHWFTRVDFIPESRLKLRRGRALHEHSRPKAAAAMARRVSRNFEAWFEGDLRAFEKIYVASDQWSLGVCLLQRRIAYTYMEDAAGMLSQQARYLTITRRFNLTNAILSEHLGGAGRSEIITEKLCDLACQQPGFHDPKAVDFSIRRTLREIIPQRVPELLAFYAVTPIELHSGAACLFLTQFNETIADPSLDTQECISTLLADYCCPNHRLIIKPHPKDRWLNYPRIFPGAQVLPNNFPSELLPFALDGALDMALTASSTSIGGVAELAREALSFGTEVETMWPRLHLMFAAARVLKHLGIETAASCRMNEGQMRNLLHTNGIGAGAQALVDGGLPGYGEAAFDAPLTLLLHFEGSEHTATADGRIAVRLIPEEHSLLRRGEWSITVFGADNVAEMHERIHLKYSRATLEIKGEHA